MYFTAKDQTRLEIIHKYISGRIPRDIAMAAIQVKERQFIPFRFNSSV